MGISINDDYFLPVASDYDPILVMAAIENASQLIDSASEISSGTIYNDHIAASTIVASEKLSAESIEAGQIASDAVITRTLQAASVSADKISVTDLASVSVNTGTLTINTDGYIVSDPFSSGALGQGFKIHDTGLAEFNDIYARGKITSSVFEYDTVSAVGGNVVVSHDADVLDSDMGADDADTALVTKGDITFATGDILRIKDGTEDEWFEVTGVTDASNYTVTRDKNSDYADGSNPTWKKGTAVVNYGQSGDGGIFMTASEANAPFLNVYTHAGSPWTTTTTRVRLGNLNGFLGENSDVYGIAIGESDKYLKYDSTNGLRVQGQVILDSGSEVDGSYIKTGILCTENVDICSGSTEGSARTVFDAYSIKSYDSSGDMKFCVTNGCVEAQDLKLQDPDCICCYSFLDSGALKFHDECGDVPYVKRICSGDINTGNTVYLSGWKTAPEVIVGIKSLCSYASSHSAQDQQWQVYADNICCYDSGGVYGYCFDVHAALILASGQGSECIKNINFGMTTCTEACTCETCVRIKLQLWCNSSAPSNYYAGCLNYAICYRVNGSGVWCANCSDYLQPHANTSQLKSIQDEYLNLTFPCEATWELMACRENLAWHDSGIASGSIECCLCSRSVSTTSTYWCECWCVPYEGGSSVDCHICGGNKNVCVAIGGSTPSNVYCTYLCYNWYSAGTPDIFAHADTSYTYCDNSNCVISTATSYLRLCGCQADSEISFAYHCLLYGVYDDCECCQHSFNNSGCMNYSAFNNCILNHLQLCMSTSYCIPWAERGSMAASSCNCTCIGSTCLYHCYCGYTGGSICCTYECFYSVCDTYGCTCTLDPSGILNWLAIAYT